MGILEITANGMCEDDPLAEFSIDPVDLMQRSQVNNSLIKLLTVF